MGATTRKASKAPRKRTSSRKAQENERTPLPSLKKRTKVPAFVHPDEIAVDGPEYNDQHALDAIDKPEDVSMQEYTLGTSIMLGDINIYPDTSFFKLGKFKYAKLVHDAARRLEKAASKTKAMSEWDSGRAAIGAKGVSKPNELQIEVEDADGWGKAETFVQRWMRAKKRDITVRLSMHYKLKGSDDEDADECEKPVKKGKKV